MTATAARHHVVDEVARGERSDVVREGHVEYDDDVVAHAVREVDAPSGPGPNLWEGCGTPAASRLDSDRWSSGDNLLRSQTPSGTSGVVRDRSSSVIVEALRSLKSPGDPSGLGRGRAPPDARPFGVGEFAPETSLFDSVPGYDGCPELRLCSSTVSGESRLSGSTLSSGVHWLDCRDPL